MEIMKEIIAGNLHSTTISLNDNDICKTQHHQYDGDVHLYIGLDASGKPGLITVLHPPKDVQ